MTQYGMGDDATIDEVINDVDTDNVRINLITFINFVLISINVDD